MGLSVPICNKCHLSCNQCWENERVATPLKGKEREALAQVLQPRGGNKPAAGVGLRGDGWGLPWGARARPPGGLTCLWRSRSLLCVSCWAASSHSPGAAKLSEQIPAPACQQMVSCVAWRGRRADGPQQLPQPLPRRAPPPPARARTRRTHLPLGKVALGLGAEHLDLDFDVGACLGSSSEFSGYSIDGSGRACPLPAGHWSPRHI